MVQIACKIAGLYSIDYGIRYAPRGFGVAHKPSSARSFSSIDSISIAWDVPSQRTSYIIPFGVRLRPTNSKALWPTRKGSLKKKMLLNRWLSSAFLNSSNVILRQFLGFRLSSEGSKRLGSSLWGRKLPMGLRETWSPILTCPLGKSTPNASHLFL